MLAIIVFAAVCWHSVEEILYLKSFFPKQFSVQEAYYSASIELIKVVIILVAIGIYYVYKSFKGYEE